MSKRAIILAGGKGTRLQPYTIAFPKPLVPIGELSILEIIIKQLTFYGFTHITIALNHQAEIIKAFCNDGSKWNVKIDYSIEDMPLSTMGPLKLIENLPEKFLVMNGDVLSDLNFGNFYDKHKNNNNIFTISAHERKERLEYGLLKINEESKLIIFKEKPMKKYLVSMGIYMANKKILKYMPVMKPYGFDNLMIDLINDRKPVAVEIHDGIWLDIGQPSDYEKAIELFKKNKEIILK